MTFIWQGLRAERVDRAGGKTVGRLRRSFAEGERVDCDYAAWRK